MEEFLTGKGWYPDSPKADEDKVTRAVINEGGIAIDYDYQGKKLYIELKSAGGICFEGRYGDHGQEIGNCRFTFSENKEAYFLDGGYSSPEEGSGPWCIKLFKPKNEHKKNEPERTDPGHS